jgi:hypothetical protein
MQKGMRATLGAMLLACLCACGGGGSGDGSATLSASPGSLSLSADTRDNTLRASIQARLDGTLDRDAQPYLEYSNSAIESASFIEDTEGRSGRVSIRFRFPETLGPGVHRDTVTLKVCYDPACTQQVRGSPKVIPVSLTVTGGTAPEPEPALPEAAAMPDKGTLALEASRLLAHDVADAEYSRALDAIVMVSRRPELALHVYSPATGTERSLVLDGFSPYAQVAVSVSPDGQSANLAFGDSIAHVNLNPAGTPFLPSGQSSLLVYIPPSSGGSGPGMGPISFTAADVVSIGADTVLAFPFGGRVGVMRVDARLNERSLLSSDALSDASARLQPGTGQVYATSRGLSLSDLARYSTAGNPSADPKRQGPSLINRALCDNLWLSANGRRIYTACGLSFRTSEYPSQDMTALGTLALSASGEGRLTDLADSAQAGQIAAIQGQNRLNLYESASTAPIGSYLIPDRQTARHVFHSADGSRKYLVAWTPDDDSYRILTVE